MDSLDGITIFVAVVRAGSFSAAAESLGCAKSTVSETVARLENRIGARLLRRSTRSVTLTEAGRAYLCRIDDLLDRVREAEQAARAEATEPRGVLRVSAPSPFAARHVAPHLPDFLARYPEVRLDLHVAAEVVDLVADGFDVALRLCPNNPPDMVIRRLGASRVIAAAAPGLLAARGRPQAPEDLTGWPAVVPAAYPDREIWHLQRAEERRAVPVTPLLVSTCQETVLRLALAGAAVVQVAECNILAELASGRLERVLPDWCVTPIPVLAVYPDNRQVAAKVRAFVDFLAKRLPPEVTGA